MKALLFLPGTKLIVIVSTVINEHIVPQIYLIDTALHAIN